MEGVGGEDLAGGDAQVEHEKDKKTGMLAAV